MKTPWNCLFTARVAGRLMWIVTAGAICGTILNVLQFRGGFAIWTATNALYAGYNFWSGQRAQAVLFAVYFAMSVWGWFAWGK